MKYFLFFWHIEDMKHEIFSFVDILRILYIFLRSSSFFFLLFFISLGDRSVSHWGHSNQWEEYVQLFARIKKKNLSSSQESDKVF